MADRVGQQFGNYQLLRLLGEGTFAAVYLGEHQYLETPAAIKVLHVRMELDTHESFRREAHTIAHLQHPHIVRILDFGFQGQTPYLVMEYTPNGTLRALHPKGTHLSFEQIILYVKQIASALDYAHEHHVIHRDVKPANLLLNANNEIVLSDFGLAVVQRTLDSISSQNAAGTPIYMAPEQIQHHPCAASDQYALGVMVYEWLCGEPPFRGPGAAVFGQHLHQPPPSLCERLPGLPPAVEDAVFGALAKDPEQRFVSAQDFADVLEEVCLATQPLLLRASSETVLQDQTAPLPMISAPVLVPALRGRDRSDDITQPRLLTPQRTGDEREQLQMVMARPSGQSHPISKQTRPSVAQRNRQTLLRRVRSFWITGVLVQSLHGAALMALGLQEQPDAVANPWHLVLQHLDIAPRPLPPGTSITQVYDSADGELLILGAPGSGKTTLLLELARDLLDRAERDEHHPLPVVFNLSSWATKQQRLTDWLVEELNTKYQVPRKLGQSLIDADQILPLLDGLDEVAAKDRTTCIEIINTYRQEHGLLPLVVCSRSADYLAQSTRVLLHSAVMVQPLLTHQIDAYLQSAGPKVEALRLALHHDPELQGLATTPLMLSILTLTYQGAQRTEITPYGSLPEKQQQVFAAYVQRMLMRGRDTPSSKTIRWLASLAQRMKRQNQTAFYIEQMQPDWLKEHRQNRLYDRFAVILPAMLTSMLMCFVYNYFIIDPSNVFNGIEIIMLLFFGAVMGIVFSTGQTPFPIDKGKTGRWRSRWRDFLSTGILSMLVGISFAVNFGVSWSRFLFLLQEPPLLRRQLPGLILELIVFCFAGILFTVIVRRRKRTRLLAAPVRSQRSLGHNLVSEGHLGNGLLLGGLIGISYILSSAVQAVYSVLTMSGPSQSLKDMLLGNLSDVMQYGPQHGVTYGVLCVLLSMTVAWMGRSIQPAEIIVWSWKSLGRSLISFAHVRIVLLIGGLLLVNPILFEFLGRVISSQNAINGGGVWNMLVYALEFGGGAVVGIPGAMLSYWLLMGLFQGVSSDVLDEHHRVIPNQGIRNSLRNALLIGLIGGTITSLIYISNIIAVNRIGEWVARWVDSIISTTDQLLRNGIIMGLVVALLVGLLMGGWASWRHGVLRILLWRAGSIPWRYARFLDQSAEHLLLRKVGGGYVFVHRLLLEYFASLESMETFKPFISRRVLLTGLAGTGVAAAGGGLTWWLLTPHPLYTYHGHSSAVYALAWSPDGKRIVSISIKENLAHDQEWGDVQVWDALDGGHPVTYPKDVGDVSRAAWSPDGKSLAFAGLNGVDVWNAITGTHRFTHKTSDMGIPAIAWSPDSKSIASSSGGSVEVWDAITGTHRFTHTTQSPIYAVAWSPDGQRIASSGVGIVEVWDATKARENALITYKWYTEHFGSQLPYALAWSPDSKHIVSTGQDTTVQVWDATTGVHRLTYTGHSQAVNAVAWSPHRDRIASASMDSTVQVWSAFDGSRVSTYRDTSSLLTLWGADPMYTVAWSPDGTKIASGDDAGLVQIWSVA